LTTRLGLVSDVHASPEPLAAALDLLAREGADRIVCVGDIAGYGDQLDATVGLLRDAGCQAIAGNHDRWHTARVHGTPTGIDAYLANLPTFIDETLVNRRVYTVHASPPDSLMAGIRLLDEDGMLLPDQVAHWSSLLEPLGIDLLVVGHTHQLFAERLGGTLVVNPGSTLFNRSCALVELPSLEVRLLPLPDVPARRVWNWRGGWK
jgi:putative phosphoesterase